MRICDSESIFSRRRGVAEKTSRAQPTNMSTVEVLFFLSSSF
jgi:hypothetical protein